MRLKLNKRYQDPEGQEPAPGGSPAGDPAPAPAATPPVVSADVQALIDQQVAQQVAGLKANTERLIAENKANKEAMAKYEGVDLDQYNQLLSQMENDEETALIAKGKISEVVDRRTQRMKEQADLNVKKAQEEARKAAEEAQQFRSENQNIILDNALRTAAINADVNPKAVDDVIARAKGVFKVTDDGQLEARDANDLLMVGADATNSMTPAEFIESLRSDHSYYWMQNNPAGMNGMSGMPKTDVAAQMTQAAIAGNQSDYQALRRKQRSGK